MEVKIITGMSGAGKTTLTKYFEESGYDCHDNFPANLIIPYIKDNKSDKIIFIVDSRSEYDLNNLNKTIGELRKLSNIDFKYIYLDCNDEELINRYRESKKLHHFQRKFKISLIDSLQRERQLIDPLKANADFVFDTSTLNQQTLLDKAKQVFEGDSNVNNLLITCMSFGYKHGTPKGIDIIYDVRVFKNPYWIPELKNKTGKDKEVIDYITSFSESNEFIEKVYDMIDFIVPLYIKEGKRQLNIAFGCTGGHHRSVCFAEMLYKHLSEKYSNVIIKHFNIND